MKFGCTLYIQIKLINSHVLISFKTDELQVASLLELTYMCIYGQLFGAGLVWDHDDLMI